jgi:hypothetical protein
MNKKISIIAAMGIVAVVLGGCMTNDKNMETLSTYAILDHKGAATGTNRIPEWLTVYLDTGMDTAVEKLSAFRGGLLLYRRGGEYEQEVRPNLGGQRERALDHRRHHFHPGGKYHQLRGARR